MNHPKCICGKDGIWKNTCGSGYVCLCECHKKEIEKESSIAGHTFVIGDGLSLPVKDRNKEIEK